MSEEKQVEKVTKISISRGVKDEVAIDLEIVEDELVYDEHGNPIRFGDIYKDQKTIIIFTRHYLCFTCKEYVEDIARIPKDNLDEMNVKLVVIGCSKVENLWNFMYETDFHHIMYTDPESKIYKGLNLLRNAAEKKVAANSPHVKSGWTTGFLRSTLRAMYYQEFRGDMEQNGGALICGPGNVVHWSHVDQHMMDHAPVNDILTAAGVRVISFPKDQRVEII